MFYITLHTVYRSSSPRMEDAAATAAAAAAARAAEQSTTTEEARAAEQAALERRRVEWQRARELSANLQDNFNHPAYQALALRAVAKSSRRKLSLSKR